MSGTDRQKVVATAGEVVDVDFVLLRPEYTPPRPGIGRIYWDISQLPLHEIRSSRYLALDTETRGTDYWIPGATEIVGLGLSWDTGYGYIPTTSGADLSEIWEVVLSHPGLLAHNVQFDGGIIWASTGQLPKFHRCTLATYRLLANEGWKGQRHGLKHAMTDVLKWDESNEEGIDEWLVLNGYISGPGVGVNCIGDEPEKVTERVRRWKETGSVKPSKADMWRVPQEILGEYCLLDVEATYLLYTRHFLPLIQKFPDLDSYLDKFTYVTYLLTLQRIHGIGIDSEYLREYRERLSVEISEAELTWKTHGEIYPHLREMRDEYVEEKLAEEPPKYLKSKYKVTSEPAKFKLDGEISKSWLKWREKMDLIESEVPQVRSDWKRWDEEISKLREDRAVTDLFNLNSKPHLSHLLYDRLGYPVKLHTDTGDRSVSSDALKGMGEIGNSLISVYEKTKEMGYLNGLVEKITEYGVDKIYPGFNAPGTVTGRLSSYGPNLQQIPKTKRYLDIFRADPGRIWVDLDFCLHPSCELLTRERGWVRILDVKMSDEIWQVDPVTLRGSWTYPLRVIKRLYSGDMYEFGSSRGKFSVTEGHTMLYVGRSQPKSELELRWIQKSEDPLPRSKVCLLTGSTSTGHVSNFSEEDIWRAAALQADSSQGTGGSYVIQVSRERKRRRLTELFGESTYMETEIREGCTLPVEIWTGIKFSHPLLLGKRLNLKVLGENQADILFDALGFWDGCRRSDTRVDWYSTDSEMVDSIQAYFSTCGYMTSRHVAKSRGERRKPLHTLTIIYKGMAEGGGGRLWISGDEIRRYTYTGYVGCVTVPTGFIQIRSGRQTFVTGNCAVEPTVTAEFSQDPNLMRIYGDGMPPNDIYLYVAAMIPKFSGEVRATGYDPLSPTKETLAAAKKGCKRIRAICKGVTLAANYGAGADKIQASLALEGVDISLPEVTEIYDAYWNLFSGVKEFEAKLKHEAQRNGRWVLNGLGRPVCIARKCEKDTLNRFVQSTGHDLLILYIDIFTRELTRRRIDWHPLIIDFHDASAVDIPEGDLDETVDVYMWAVGELNHRLNGTIKLKGEPTWGIRLTQLKEPEE